MTIHIKVHQFDRTQLHETFRPVSNLEFAPFGKALVWETDVALASQVKVAKAVTPLLHLDRTDRNSILMQIEYFE